MMNNPLHQRDGELQHLNTSELTLADRNLDIRDRKVVDRDGLEIGRVSDLFIYYGLSPYWGESYMYPDFPIDRTPPVRD